MPTDLEPRPEKLAAFSAVLDAMMALERRYDLFSRQIDGVFFWELIRFELFHRLLGPKGPFAAVLEPSHASIAERSLGAIPRIASALYRNPFFDPQCAENVVLLHSRKWQVDGRWVDPYLGWIVDWFGAERCAVYDRSMSTRIYQRPLGPFERTLDFVHYASRIGGRLFPVPVTREADIALLRDIEIQLAQTLGQRVSLRPLVSLHVRRFKIARSLYKRVFRRKHIKRAITAVAYERHAFIAAAKDLEMETIEVQHGIIGPHHPGYNYDVAAVIPYKPDSFLTFGAFWSDWGPFARGVNMVPVGAPTIATRLSAYRDSRPKDIDVIFISQSEKLPLFQFAVRFSELLPQARILFRPHPSESIRFYRDQLAQSADLRARIQLATHNEFPDTLALQSRARYQIGIYSTALLEGMALGCTTLLAGLPGAEHFQHLVASGDFLNAETPERAVEIVCSGREVHLPLTPFEPLNENQLRSIF